MPYNTIFRQMRLWLGINVFNSRRHSPYTENPYKGTLSFTLTYCIQIELFYNATFYTLEDGVLKEIECIFYEIEGIFDGFGQPGRWPFFTKKHNFPKNLP